MTSFYDMIHGSSKKTINKTTNCTCVFQNRFYWSKRQVDGSLHKAMVCVRACVCVLPKTYHLIKTTWCCNRSMRCFVNFC